MLSELCTIFHRCLISIFCRCLPTFHVCTASVRPICTTRCNFRPKQVSSYSHGLRLSCDIDLRAYQSHITCGLPGTQSGGHFSLLFCVVTPVRRVPPTVRRQHRIGKLSRRIVSPQVRELMSAAMQAQFWYSVASRNPAVHRATPRIIPPIKRRIRTHTCKNGDRDFFVHAVFLL